MTSRTKRVMIALSGLLILAAPAFAQRYGRTAYQRESAFRFHLGAFRPEGDSDYWRDKEDQFTGDVGDLEDVSFGFDYLLPINDRVSIMFGSTFYEGETTNAYRDFVDNFGDRIRHDTTLDIISGTAGVVLHLTSPGSAIQPYVGAGIGFYPWQLEESGDFIGSGPTLPIFNATLASDGVAFGYYGLVGLEAPITRHFGLYAEGRWTQAEDDLSGDFESFGKIDLSGREVTAGISWSL